MPPAPGSRTQARSRTQAPAAAEIPGAVAFQPVPDFSGGIPRLQAIRVATNQTPDQGDLQAPSPAVDDTGQTLVAIQDPSTPPAGPPAPSGSSGSSASGGAPASSDSTQQGTPSGEGAGPRGETDPLVTDDSGTSLSGSGENAGGSLSDEAREILRNKRGRLSFRDALTIADGDPDKARSIIEGQSESAQAGRGSAAILARARERNAKRAEFESLVNSGVPRAEAAARVGPLPGQVSSGGDVRLGPTIRRDNNPRTGEVPPAIRRIQERANGPRPSGTGSA